jgi:hypothetical protein
MSVITRKRPVLLTIVCILGYIWVVFSFVGVFNPALKKLGDWYPALFGIIVACTFISYVGTWHMKRWGPQLFISTFFIKESALILINDVSYFGILVSVFFICSMVPFYKRMDSNL